MLTWFSRKIAGLIHAVCMIGLVYFLCGHASSLTSAQGIQSVGEEGVAQVHQWGDGLTQTTTTWLAQQSSESPAQWLHWARGMSEQTQWRMDQASGAVDGVRTQLNDLRGQWVPSNALSTLPAAPALNAVENPVPVWVSAVHPYAPAILVPSGAPAGT